MTNNTNNMEYEYVVKRDNSEEEVSFDKIQRRIKNLSKNLTINPTRITKDICSQIYNKIKTSDIDELSAQICASLCTEHPDYGVLASRIIISNHHKNTSPSFSETIRTLYENTDKNGTSSPLISKELFTIVEKNKTKLNDMIKYDRDYLFDYFGFKTLEKSYLMKINGEIIERPQHLIMRVALGIHGIEIKEALKTYDLISNKYFIHATPTLFNAGTNRPQLSSCFLLAMKDDSIDGIFSTLKDCALISKWAGGIGLHIHNVRAKTSSIRGTNGISNGLVPMLRVFNNTARYVDQCVLPETIIYTTKGPKKIQDVVVGETEIYNLNGNVEVVENVLEHPYDGKLISIDITHSLDKLSITPEHPVYCLKGQKKSVNYDVIKDRLKNNLVKPEWVDAGELTYEDMIVYPIPKYEKDISNITKEDCYVYGVILGDGCLQNNKEYGYISLNTKSKGDVLEKVTHYFNSKFIRNRTENNDTTTRIYWNKDVSLPFKYSDVYYNKEKICHSRWLNLPLEKSKYILKGLLDTDGSKGNEIVFDSTSYNLIEAVRFICLRMGILTSGYVRDRVGETHVTKSGNSITNQKISYSLRIPKVPEICSLLDMDSKDYGKFFKFIRYENLLFSRIKNISETTYNGTLYDLQLKQEHNYLLHQGLVHNGGGKRNGSIAMYLEPWHADVEDFLLLRKNHGNEEDRARDLFYALWISDLFMKRVRDDADWTLFCPDECPGLSDCYGEKFEELYTKYESENRGKRTVKAQELWFQILESQIETGTPYLLYKDACNRKSNQQNLGTIKSSNLCCEIVEYSSKDEYAVCNLASIGLSKYVIDQTPKIEYEKIKVYSVNNCKYCTMAKDLLKENNIEFEEHLLEGDTDKKKFLKSANTICEDGVCKILDSDNQIRTFPQIYIDDKRIGGFTELNELLRPKAIFDYDKLHKVVKVITKNLDKVIDINYYPIPETRRSNMLHRPIGIGVQGLADVFAILKIPFDSDEAKEINEKIFETIYFSALETSVEISKKRESQMKKLVQYQKDRLSNELSNEDLQSLDKEIEKLTNQLNPIPEEINRDKYLGAYSSFENSPASKGILQYDLWEQECSKEMKNKWTKLKKDIQKYGIRNSLLLAPMPTASTSQILGNNEAIEPFTSNIYLRRTLAGEFVVINKYLIRKLVDLNIWSEKIKNQIIKDNGSVQNIQEIPEDIREVFKTVWEVGNKPLIDMAASRGRFICQSQSLNLFMDKPDFRKLSSMHFYSWKQGLKTGIYYLRTKPVAQAQKFTIEPEKRNNNSNASPSSGIVYDDTQECVACGS